jgi:hypothetical protein
VVDIDADNEEPDKFPINVPLCDPDLNVFNTFDDVILYLVYSLKFIVLVSI